MVEQNETPHYVDDEELNRRIIEGMERDGYIENDTQDNDKQGISEDMDDYLLTTEWVEEAKQIPLEVLSELERDVVLKCIDQSPMNQQEKDILSDVLERYRPAIQKIKPLEQLENYEHNTQYVEDEQAFLKMVEQYDEIQVIPFTYYIGERKVQMKFDLYPITDSTAIADINRNLGMFENLTLQEATVQDKIQKGLQLTREEKIIEQELTRKILETQQDKSRIIAIKYLAMQLKFHGKDSNVETMEKVFGTIPDAYLSLLFDEVQRRNHISDINVEEVFQEFN